MNVPLFNLGKGVEKKDISVQADITGWLKWVGEMQVSNSRYRVLKEAITTWQQEKVIDATQAKHLLKNLTIEAFD